MYLNLIESFFETITVYKGIIVWNFPIFVWVNFIAFLITLIVIFRVGSGDLIKPVFFFALSFLMPVFVPILFGIEYYWFIPLIQTLFSFIGIASLMKVLGIFELLAKKE